jgi:Fe-S-cluster containining protein
MRRARRTGQSVTAQLDALYAELPSIECRGKCWDSCGPILMTRPEQARIAAAGVDVSPSTWRDGPMICPALTMLRRCAVYEARPMICRLWGLAESMPCNFGCRPEGGLLSDRVAYEYLARAHEIAGELADAARIRAAFATPAAAAEMAEILRRQREETEVARLVRMRRAEAKGTALYALGPGRLTRERTEQCR